MKTKRPREMTYEKLKKKFGGELCRHLQIRGKWVSCSNPNRDWESGSDGTVEY